MRDLVLKVASVRKETPSTRVVRLDLQSQPFSYLAGQAAKIGPVDRAEHVPYSIASAPEETARDGRIEFLIKVHADGLWGEDFEIPRRGSRMRVHGPLGRFVFPEKPDERCFLFIAGGTGIAPLRSMIRHALARKQPGRMRLFYSARTPADFPYLRELRALARERCLELTLTATRECAAGWHGGRGRISGEQLAPLIDDRETLCFVCGPAAMVDDVPVMLRQLGISRSRIRLEEW